MSSPAPASTKLSWSNLGVGAAVSLFEVTTLGQPLEVLKTHQAANRNDTLTTAFKKTYARGGLSGFWQGLIPWAWIESGLSGGVLIFTSSFVEDALLANGGVAAGTAGLAGGILGGGILFVGSLGADGFLSSQMKTAEITRMKALHGTELRFASTIPGYPGAPIQVPSTWKLFANTYNEGGIRAINKGVNAVAIRQMTNWGSRMGFARASESLIREAKGMRSDAKLGTQDKVLASAIGGEPRVFGGKFSSSRLIKVPFTGVLGCWNHPIEVVRVEMQSLAKAERRPAKLTILSTFRYIYEGKPPRMLGANGSPPRGVANGTAEHLIHISGQVGLRRLSLRGFSRPLGANILEKAGPDLKTLIIHNFSLTEAPSDGLSLPFQLDHLALFGGPFPTFFLSSIISSSLPTITSLTLVTFALPAIQSPLLRLPHLQSLASQLTSLSLHFQLRDPALRDTIASSIGPRLSAFTSIYDLTLNPIEFEPMMDLLRFLPSNPPTLEHLALGVEADQAYPGHSWSHPERQKNWEGLMGSKVMKALETVSWLSNGRQGDRHPAQSPEMMKLLKAGRELRMEWL
ncbi:hypothetical protein P7C70_g8169, partial [Phenoliferia sp. Uapishka_3]